jgi:hypothetical protein
MPRCWYEQLTVAAFLLRKFGNYGDEVLPQPTLTRHAATVTLVALKDIDTYAADADDDRCYIAAGAGRAQTRRNAFADFEEGTQNLFRRPFSDRVISCW